MGGRLFVENLGAATTNLRLEQIFSRHGRVSGARIVMDQETGCSQCCGYVQMSSRDEAQRAIAALHGKVVDGLPLAIREMVAEEEPEIREIRPRYGNGRSRTGGAGVRWGRRS